MSKKVESKKMRVDSIEGLAGLIVEFHEETNARFDAIDARFKKVDDRFDTMDERFVSLETEMRNGFEENRRILDRIETRIVNLERAVFGRTNSDGGA